MERRQRQRQRQRVRWIVAIVALLASLAGMTAALTPDGLALLEFKNTLNSSSQSPLLGNWKSSDASPCYWGGIVCTRSGFVRNISLASQGLEGVISPSLGKLRSLQNLTLYNNSLSGSIPPELGNCSRLVTLSLYENLLSGEIPAAVAALPNLVTFDVGTNRLTGRVPPVIYQNTKLEHFYVNDNNLTGDITSDLEALSKLPAIVDIWMHKNYFSGELPASLGNATTLKNLILNHQSNGASSFGGRIPREIGMLGSLVVLNLQDNNFTGNIPPELGNLTMLESMFLSTNHLTGGIPREFGQLQNMQELHLYSNKLEGPLPAELGDCHSLREAILYVNSLTGPIPSSFGKLGNLTVLELHNNTMSGPIPVEFFNCTSLQSLFLTYNMFSGTIPPEIGKLTLLTNLRMNFNNFSGPFPEEIANLGSLVELVLNSNGLTGEIPRALSNVTTLTDIYLYDNYLSGPLPPDLGMVSNLGILDIRNNAFTGTLPEGLCRAGYLNFVDIHLNRFEGPIPSSLATCRTLKRFIASSNRLTRIPDGFGKNSSLTYMDLSGNPLVEGPLPKGIGSNSNLSNLALRGSSLTGDLSALEFSQLPNLQSLDLSMNNFTGEIPAAMASCVKLFHLDLSFNSLSGTVPAALANLSKLKVVNLQGNNLTGTMDPTVVYSSWGDLQRLNLAENPWNGPIPAGIGAVSSLAYLNLSYGGYTGSIPAELRKLTQLEVLDLSHNALSGEVPAVLEETVSLLSVNVSHNRLTGALPPTWVKLLGTNPSGFVGNTGLCVQYSTDDLCMNTTVVTPVGSGGKKKSLSVGVILGVILGSTLALIFVGAFCFYWCCSRKVVEDSAPVEPSVKFMSSPGVIITLEEIMAVTGNLSDGCVIGRGGHGVVYKAVLASGTPIVVKKIASLDKTKVVHKSFWREIETVGNAKHRNLVKLLGFCKWGKVGLLLYDYVPNGDVYDALHNKELGLALNWKSRLRIAEGVAHGLSYLHHDYDPPIVHRDIKASNVLLDDDFEAHISDFGIAKVLDMQPRDDITTSTSVVSGTYGYIAPEAGYGAKVTPKLDVYSYGVLLLEILTGKQPADASFGESMHIAAWVRKVVQENEGRMSESVLDPWLLRSSNLAHQAEMLDVLKIAMLCTTENPTERPTMQAVVEMLRKIGK